MFPGLEGGGARTAFAPLERDGQVRARGEEGSAYYRERGHARPARRAGARLRCAQRPGHRLSCRPCCNLVSWYFHKLLVRSWGKPVSAAIRS